jgi:hypothetical protein
VAMSGFLYSVSLVFIALCSVIYFVKPLDVNAMRQFGDISAVAASLFALALMAYALPTFNKRDKQRTGWILLTMGIALYFLGEASWSYIELIMGVEVPFPSIADLFWLLGYIPLFVGLAIIYQRLAVKLTGREKAIFAIFGLVLILFSYVFLFRPIVQSSEISVMEKLLDLVYPTWDIFLAVPALAVLLIYGRGLLGRTWLFIGLGFLFFTAADLLFSYLTWIGKFKTGSLVDLLWIAGYILIAISAINQIRLVQRTRVVQERV